MAKLSEFQRQRFLEDGYLVVEGVLDPVEDIAPIIKEYNGVLDGIARGLVAEGVIASAYEHLPFNDRLIQICQESGRNFPGHFDISLPQENVTLETPIHLGPRVFGLLTNPRLLDVAESIVGPEVYSNPVQHIRMKLPKRALAADIGADNLVVQTPWHQDNGVILPEADEASILTIWLPLNDATIENGCMQVLPGSHRTGLEDHCPVDGEISIPKKLLDLQQAVTLPMKAGSVLLMHQHTAHASLANQTYDTVRLSFDLRYQPVGQPTGRPAFPGFVARSAAQPESVLRDPDVWKQLWLDTRARLAPAEDPVYNRWDGSAAVCA